MLALLLEEVEACFPRCFTELAHLDLMLPLHMLKLPFKVIETLQLLSVLGLLSLLGLIFVSSCFHRALFLLPHGHFFLPVVLTRTYRMERF